MIPANLRTQWNFLGLVNADTEVLVNHAVARSILTNPNDAGTPPETGILRAKIAWEEGVGYYTKEQITASLGGGKIPGHKEPAFKAAAQAFAELKP